MTEKTYEEARQDWRNAYSRLSTKCSGKLSEIRALETQLADLLAAIVDCDDPERLQELRYTWQECRANLNLAAAAYELLDSRLDALRKREPSRHVQYAAPSRR